MFRLSAGFWHRTAGTQLRCSRLIQAGKAPTVLHDHTQQPWLQQHWKRNQSTATGNSTSPVLSEPISRALTRQFNELLRQGDLHEAQKLFAAARANGAANDVHWTLMMRHLCETSEERQRMVEQMMQSGITPNRITYQDLLEQLMIEGKVDDARRVTEEEMPAAGVALDPSMVALVNSPEDQWGGIRMRRLKGLLNAGTERSAAEAWKFFEILKANHVTHVFHWNLMMQHVDRSEQCQVMMGQMSEAGLKPNVYVFNALIRLLLFEGRTQDASEVVDTHMPEAGVTPNGQSHKLLHKPEQYWSRSRAVKLKRLIKTGTRKGMDQARSLFELLKESKLDDGYSWNVMMISEPTSGGRRRMMQEMDASGVKPDVITYTVRLQQLMLEGNAEEAREVVRTEMPAAEVTPNEQTNRIMRRSERMWLKIRHQHLDELLRASSLDKTELAQTLFEVLKANRAADSGIWHLMMSKCETSSQCRDMIEEMNTSGVGTNAYTYDLLVQKLIAEGNSEEAQRVAEMEMPDGTRRTSFPCMLQK